MKKPLNSLIYLFKYNDFKYKVNSKEKPNSCYFNLIYKIYAPQLDQKRPDWTHYYADFSYSSLCDLLGVENKDYDIGLSIKNSVKFFEKYHLGLLVFNRNGEILYDYKPKDHALNIKLHPNILKIVIHNRHSFKINIKEKSIEQLYYNGKLDLIEDIKQKSKEIKLTNTSNFVFRNFEKESEAETIFVNDLEDIINKM